MSETNRRRRAWGVLALWILVDVLAIVGAQAWRTDNRLERWVEQLPRDAAWEVLRDRFGGDETVLVRVDRIPPRDAGDAGDTEDAEARELESWLRSLGERLRADPAVRETADPLALPGFSTAGPIAWERLAARPLVVALDLVEADGSRLDLILPVRLDATPAERQALVDRLAGFSVEAEGHGARLRAAGHPLVASALDAESARVERVFVPVLVLLAGLSVAALLRSFALAGLALLPAVGVSAGTRAVLALLGRDADLILVAVGPLTFVLLLAATLHLLLEYRHLRAHGATPADAARGARRVKASSILLAAVTTSVGFAVFLASGLRSVADLGLAVSLAVLVGAVAILAGLPSLLGGLAIDVPRRVGPARTRWRGLAFRAVRRRRVVVLCGALVLGVGLPSGLALRTATNGLHYFPRGHPVRAQFTSIEAEGTWLSSVEVLVRRADGTPWTPDGLAEFALEEDLLALPAARHVFGPEDMLAETATLGVVGRLARPEALRRASRVDETGEWARWTVRFPTGEADAARALCAALREVAEARGEASGTAIEVRVAGSVTRMLDMQHTLVGTLVSSLALTLLVTTALFRLAVRTLRELGIALFVNLVPVGVVFLIATGASLPLDGATVMVAAVVLGLAVDNTFHLLHAGGVSPRSRLRAFDAVGRAAATASTALAIGFACLAASGFAPTQRFGILCAAGAAAALVGDLVLLPALWVPGRRTSREAPR